MYKYCPFCGNSIILKNFSVRCGNCNKAIYLNSKPTVSVVLMCGDHVLMGRRGIEPSIGKLDLLGGFLEYGEEVLEGAVREMEEETGLKINGQDLKYVGSWVGEYLFEGNKYFTLNMVYILPVKEQMILKPNDDVSELVWLSVREDVEWAFPIITKVMKTVEKNIV